MSAALGTGGVREALDRAHHGRASTAIAAICAVDGLDGSALTALESVSTDVFTALVWLGKSDLAELTSAVASLWMVVTCDCRPLIPLLVAALVSPLTEFWRLLRSEQYAGLLLPPHPAATTSATAATVATAVRIAARRLGRLDTSTLFCLSSMASGYAAERGSASAKKDEIRDCSVLR